MIPLLGLNLFSERTLHGERSYRNKWKVIRKWISPEGVQCFPVRYTALTENSEHSFCLLKAAGLAAYSNALIVLSASFLKLEI